MRSSGQQLHRLATERRLTLDMRALEIGWQSNPWTARWQLLAGQDRTQLHYAQMQDKLYQDYHVAVTHVSLYGSWTAEHAKVAAAAAQRV
jgi:hypothetical protein